MSEISAIKVLMQQTDRLRVTQSRELVESHLRNAMQDLLILADFKEVLLVLKRPHTTRHSRILAQRFKSIAERRGLYDQIRLIDLSGKEVVRLNYRNSIAVGVPQHELQDKSGRYYFTETMSKGPGKIFVSAMDLNIEYGKIEVPYKPVIRLATPIYDESGSKLGMVIINYLAEKLIASLTTQLEKDRGKILLLNRDGYWLKGETSADEWGFMFTEKKGLTMAARYPDAWRNIIDSDTGQLNNEHGFFAFTTVTVDKILVTMGQVGESLSGYDKEQSSLWKLVQFTPISDHQKQAYAMAERYLAVSAVLLVIWGLVALLLSRARLFKLETDKQLHEKEQRISEIVNTAFDAIITINERGVIETFNPAACKLFDYREEDVVGHKVNMLMASPAREYHDLHIQNYIESGVGKFVGKSGRVTGLRSDGKEVDIEICIGAKEINDHWLFTAVCRP
ncbi:MAG: PAS domain S-box protein [Candidatus Thiodiazotropha sp.]